MTKKTTLIILSVFLGAILITAFFMLRPRPSEEGPETGQATTGSLNSQQFMTAEDKESFGLSTQSRVQVISRDAAGEISVYKIIRSDSDIVSDPSRLPAISPDR